MGIFTSSSKSETTVDPMRRDITLDWQNRLLELSRKPQEFFPDQTYAERDPRQLEALGMREDYARGLGGMVQPAEQAWRSMLAAPDVAQNPYVQGMLEQQRSQVMRGLGEAMPGIQSGMLGVNERLGGTGQGVAAGIAGRGAMEALANQAARTQMDAYRAGLQQQQYGLGAAPAMAQFGLMPSDVLAGVGATERGEEQRAINEAMQRHQFEQEEPWRRLERFIGTYEPASQAYTTTKAKETYSPSAMQVGGQLVGMVSSLMGSMMGGLGGGGGGGDPWARQTGGGYAPAGGGSSYAGSLGMGSPYQMPAPTEFAPLTVDAFPGMRPYGGYY